MSNENPAAIVAELKTSIEGIKALVTTTDKQVKEIAAQSATGLDAANKVGKDALAAAEKAANDVTALVTRITENEQKLFDQIKAGRAAPKSLGQIIIETDDFKNFAAGKTKSISIDVQNNTITGQDGGSPARNSDTIVPADRMAGINPGAFRLLRVRDVIPAGNTVSNAIEYTRELAFTNSAAETAEGDTKPQSALTFDLQTAPVRTIAHWLKLSKQVKEDAPALASYIDVRLRFGVEQRIDSQLLNGNGSSQNLAGLLKNGNYQGFNPTAGETALDSINRMKYLVAANDYQASAIMMNPVTWGEIERIKGNDDHYIIGIPQSAMGPFLWGLPVIVTNAMPQGKAHVSSIETLAMIFNRSNTVVEMFEQDDTNVQKNLITVRAEARLALAVFRSQSAVYGALTRPGASA
jgi:HK97 family phage major capsid protein